MTDCIASHSADETRRLGRELGRDLQPGDVLALSGDLGAGKTCLVQGLAEGLDVPASATVTSPTFTLVGQYPGRIELRHADFYRVESYTRLDDAGFDDLLDGTGVVVVEWPERCWEALPEERLELRLELISESARRIHLNPVGTRARQICGRLLARWR